MAPRGRPRDRSRLAAPAAFLLAVLVVAMTGCVLKKPPDAAALKAEALPTVQVPTQWTAPGVGAGPVTDNWLATFGDAQLTGAVAEAIAYNADLRVAAARVEQAQLYAKLAGAKLYPSVDLLARGGAKMSGDNSGLKGALLTMTWEIDLWGRVRYGRAAAAADAMSAQADFEYARQSMAAVVAKSWFLATEAALQAEVARATIQSAEELVRLAQTRSQVGVGNDEDVYVARASVGTYRDALREIELSRAAGDSSPGSAARQVSGSRRGCQRAAAGPARRGARRTTVGASRAPAGRRGRRAARGGGVQPRR